MPIDPASPMKSSRSGLLQRLRARLRYAFLLGCLVAFILLQPLFLAIGQDSVLGIFASLLIIGAFGAVSPQRVTLTIGLVLGVPYFIAMWIDVATASVSFELIATVSATAFLAYVTIVILKDVMFTGRITADTLYGAACVYLLIGTTWYFAYLLAETLSPGSFSLSDHIVRDDTGSPASEELFYFSMVTLTTLGYGDVTPIRPFARALAITEAVTGVLYTTVLVARLVGLYRGSQADQARGQAS